MGKMKKFYNMGIISSSWMVSSMIKTPVIAGMPFALGIELTNYCNLKCPECMAGSGTLSRPRGYMEDELFKRIITELSPYVNYLMFYFQGESMMHPNFFDYLDESKGMGAIISSNGHFIDANSATRLAASGARKVIISLDGFTQEVYSRYRQGGEVEKVIDSVRLLSQAFSKVKKSPALEVQFLVSSYNENEIDKVRLFAEREGARFSPKSMQVISQKSHDSLLPSNKRFRRYHSTNGRYILKSRLANRCARLWTSPVITWDGKVVPCCFDKDADHIMGDMYENTFKKIWRSTTYKKFRKDILNNRAGIEICKNCTQGLAKGIII